MVTFERILCAVDLSEASQRALRCALGLARECQAAVRVVHVADLQHWLPTSADAGDAMVAETLARLEEHLGWWVARSLGAGDGAATEVREGPIVAGILEAAVALRADAIVVGSHGRAGFDRQGPGSVAERVVQQARCPVLVVPARTTAVVRQGAPGRVVCAIDIARPRPHAISYGQLMAEGSPMPLSVVTVIDWPLAGAEGGVVQTEPLPAINERAGRLLHWLAARAGTGVPATVVVRHGRAGLGILAYAREVAAELIVLGTPDPSAFGATLHHVLRDAHCPVLVVPDRPDRHGD